MKHILIFAAAIGVIAGTLGQTSRITSDKRQGLPAPGTIFVPPNDQIFDTIETNEIPLLVRREAWSNVVRRTIWYKNGHAQTNDMIISSNLISVTTNDLTLK